jgi:hypothetical protein
LACNQVIAPQNVARALKAAASAWKKQPARTAQPRVDAIAAASKEQRGDV